MRVTITGASGLIGKAVIAELRRRSATEITVLSRDPERTLATLGSKIEAVRWSATEEPAPASALAGRDAVVHLAGEPVAQRWSARAKRAIHESRVLGTRNLLAGLSAADPRPGVLACSSAIGIYGARHEEPLDEEAELGHGFLAETCIAWAQEARSAGELGMRVVNMRTGVVLDAHGGALAKMLPPFRMGIGGPVAGGRQYVSWIHLEDLAAMILAAIEQEPWSGPVNATAPNPVTNSELSHVLGRVLHRPALLPVPAAALKALYGEMAEIVTTGQRVLPAKALVLGYQFRHPDLQEALESALA
jgi:uncharacterized protein (TIGR01777 family)